MLANAEHETDQRRRCVGLGAGGHAKCLLEIVREQDTYEVVGMLAADPQAWGSAFMGAEILGGDELLPELIAEGVCYFFNGIGGVTDALARRRIYMKARDLGLSPIDIVHRSAMISRWVELGGGVTLLAGSYVGPDVRIGENVLINTGAIVEHDCRLEDHVHIAIGARLAGDVRADKCALVGAGATVRHGVRIGEGAIVGAGAVVLVDVAPGDIVVGVPAHRLVKGKK